MGLRNKVYIPEPVVDPVPEGMPFERTCDNIATEITTFLSATYNMVSDGAHDDAVSWSPSGSTFVVHSPTKFAAMLGEHFKHSNFQSYVRQLNMYNFHKVKSDNRWEFFHNYFVRGHPELLPSIKRKSTRKNPKKSASSAASASSTAVASTRPRPAPTTAAERISLRFRERSASARQRTQQLAASSGGLPPFPAPRPVVDSPLGNAGPADEYVPKAVPQPLGRGVKRERANGEAPQLPLPLPLPLPLAERHARPPLPRASPLPFPPHPSMSSPMKRPAISLQSRSAKDALNVRKLSPTELAALEQRVRSKYPGQYANQVFNEILTRRNVHQLDLLDSFYTTEGVIVSRSSSPMPSITPRPPSAKRRKTLAHAALPGPSGPSIVHSRRLSSGPRTTGSHSSAALYPMLASASEGTFFDQTLPSSLSYRDLHSAGFDDVAIPVLASPAPALLPSPSGMPMQTFVDSLLEPLV